MLQLGSLNNGGVVQLVVGDQSGVVIIVIFVLDVGMVILGVLV